MPFPTMRSLYAAVLVALAVPGLAEDPTSTTNTFSKAELGSKPTTTGASASGAPNVILVTVAIEALTTTFTPAPTCSEHRLSMMASPGYQIWLNEPNPVAGSRVPDCYPPQFMKRYTSAVDQSSSLAPLMSPLVCPLGWHTARQWDHAYIVCCESGWDFAPPSVTSDTDRPGYGGTCYSQFTKGEVATVTGYDSKDVTATFPFTAKQTNDQAYAHPMDGFAMDLLATLTSGTTSSSTSTGTSDAGTASGSGTNSGAISAGAIAGIVIGVVIGLALLGAAIFLLFRRRRDTPKQQPPNTPIGELGGAPVMVSQYNHHNGGYGHGYGHGYDGKPIPPAKDGHLTSSSGFTYGPRSNPSASPVQSSAELDDSSTVNPSSIMSPSSMGYPGSRKDDIELSETKGRNYAELDAGWKGHEMS